MQQAVWVDFDINESFRSLIVKWQVGTKYSVNKNERTARKDKIILPLRHTQNKDLTLLYLKFS